MDVERHPDRDLTGCAPLGPGQIAWMWCGLIRPALPVERGTLDGLRPLHDLDLGAVLAVPVAVRRVLRLHAVGCCAGCLACSSDAARRIFTRQHARDRFLVAGRPARLNLLDATASPGFSWNSSTNQGQKLVCRGHASIFWRWHSRDRALDR